MTFQRSDLNFRYRVYIFIVATLLLSFLTWIFIRGQDLASQTKDELKSPEFVRFALFSRPSSLDFANVADVSLFSILRSVHLGLVTTNYREEVVSGAATSWDVSSDGTIYTFHLNPELKFHNGQPLSCDDVKYSFDTRRESAAGVWWKNILHSVQCASVHEAIFRLNYPSASFLPLLSHLESSILSSKLSSMQARTVMGLGPYKITQKYPYFRLEKLESHPILKSWSPKTVILHVYSTMDEALADFEAGKLDIVPMRNFDYQGKLDNVVESLDYSRIWMLLIGDRAPPKLSKWLSSCWKSSFDIRRFAEAVSGVRHGQFVPAFGVNSPQMPGYIVDDHIEVAEPCSEIPRVESNGTLMNIFGHVPSPLLKAVENSLAPLFNKFQINSIDKSAFIERVISRDYDMALASYGLHLSPEINLHAFYGSGGMIPFIPDSEKIFDRALREIDATPLQKDRSWKMVALQRAASKTSLIPLFFERTSYLLSKCLSMEHIQSRTAIEDFHEIGEEVDCE